MTDEGVGGRRFVEHRDYTEAMRRAHVIARYGPNPKDRFPARVRPTNQQFAIQVFGTMFLLVVWWTFRRLLDSVAPGQLWVAAAVAVPFGLAALWHRKPIDGRPLPRTARSVAGHLSVSHGRTVGPWLVHGRVVRNTRRRPKAEPPVMVPAREGDR